MEYNTALFSSPGFNNINKQKFDMQLFGPFSEKTNLLRQNQPTGLGKANKLKKIVAKSRTRFYFVQHVGAAYNTEIYC